MPLPPEHVLSAFHAETGATGTRRAQGDQLGPVWDNGIKVGDVVYSQAGPFAAWSAKVRERLSVQGARVSRPVLSSDGRHTAAGWKATQFIPGQVRGRIDETAQMALRLDAAIAQRCFRSRRARRLGGNGRGLSARSACRRPPYPRPHRSSHHHGLPRLQPAGHCGHCTERIPAPSRLDGRFGYCGWAHWPSGR